MAKGRYDHHVPGEGILRDRDRVNSYRMGLVPEEVNFLEKKDSYTLTQKG